MIVTKRYTFREKFSWSLYDWANSVFATTVLAGFFPLFFKSYWASDLDDATSTALLGTASSVAGLIIVLIAPLLGAMADISHRKKLFLFIFALLGIISTSILFFISYGFWQWSLIIFGLSVIGFSGANIFYDSLLIDVSSDEDRNYVSSMGYALGYLGGGILFLINVSMYLYPSFFYLDSQAEGILYSFLSVAIWWFLFSVPLFLFVKQKKFEEFTDFKNPLKQSFLRVFNTFIEIKRYKPVLIFLIAYWFYIDAIDTIVRMAVAYGTDLGFDSSKLIIALIFTQFIGFPATFAYGYLAEKFGLFNMLVVGILIYIFICIYSLFITSATDFFILAGLVGLVQGGVQSVSRTIFSRLIPEEKATEFFGFYNLIGKSAVVVGPALVGWMAYIFNNPKAGIISLLILFIPGILILFYVPRTSLVRD
ncbi:MFS transporter [Gammaproteobacteria bacterium]|nr:MFS transporter [Gammaproteobacteria bacterium]